jgi:CheY-like chemotaxis protein
MFTLELPVIRVAQSEIISKIASNESQVRALVSGQPQYRVLVVEDQFENRLLLKSLLESVGFQVFEAVNGKEGIEQFIRWQPHFIWMDRQMPIMDGMEATQKIRALPNGKAVKIVAVTASAFLQQQQEFLDAGANAIISKPYREAEIFNCMEKQLGVHFSYEERINKQKAVAPLNEAELKQLPQELLLKLQTATTSLDIEQSAAVIELISAVNKPLADGLSQHLEQFDFEAITKLL